ncbi:MAG TPA: caspase family protein [Burkholderiaceae bacterium]|nr:caspase family protein [Burkholderiaceae bacterium]
MRSPGGIHAHGRLQFAFKAVLLLVALTFAIPCVQAAGREITEKRIALVIGNAAYRNDPLDNPVNDARMIAQSLGKAGFEVSLRENLDRNGLVNAVREFSSRLNENTIAVLYYAGHGLQLRDRNYLIPIDADIRNEDEIPITSLDLGFLLGRMSEARSRINIVILDACRNNPFIGRAGPKAQGLAQMDAPVGSLLAYSTAPGKLAADGLGGPNSLYALHLAKHLLTPGLPVEHVFKRVREGVVRDTQGLQVPWESSSLQGEFAFVPGTTQLAQSRETQTDIEAAGEIAFWNSIQASTRADEYRAYLRQYPSGRFAALAQTRVAAYTPATATATAPTTGTSPPSGSPTSPPSTVQTARRDTLPHVGDTWRYRVQDQFRIGDLFLTARVEGVTAEGVAESWTTTSDAKLRTALAPLEPGFYTLPGWTLTPPEFSPYLLASGSLKPGQTIPGQPRRIEQAMVALRGRVEGEEEVAVGAGRFHTLKLVLRGQASMRGGGRTATVSTEHTVWYAPQVKRMVKYTVSTRVGDSVREATTFELVEYKLN